MAVDVAELQRFVQEGSEIPSKFQTNYDREADVLYVTFERAAADDSDLTDDDVVLRYREGRLIGITILHASKRPDLHIDP